MQDKDHKLRAALGVMSGRLACDDTHVLAALGFDTQEFVVVGKPSKEACTLRAEETVFTYLTNPVIRVASHD
jgi:hypothetical protein